jgi:hypothetical protein
MKSLYRITNLVVAYIIASPAQSATAPWQKLAYISNSFYEVALGSEYGRGDYRVRKWIKPIKIYVQHNVGDKTLQDELVNAHIQHLSNITHLKISRVQSLKQANLKLFFTDQKHLSSLTTKYSGKAVAKLNTTSTCIANINLNNNAQVNNAQIYIPVDFAYRKGKLVACIVEELTQILGLPRDSEKVFPSIFNDKSTDDLLTGLDETLIRVLYDPRVKAGMRKRALSPVIKQVIRKLDKTGLIASANMRVKESKLHTMLGY